MNCETEGEPEATDDENYTFFVPSHQISNPIIQKQNWSMMSVTVPAQRTFSWTDEHAVKQPCWNDHKAATVITVMTNFCLGIYVTQYNTAVRYILCSFTIIPDKIYHLTESFTSPTEHDIVQMNYCKAGQTWVVASRKAGSRLRPVALSQKMLMQHSSTLYWLSIIDLYRSVVYWQPLQGGLQKHGNTHRHIGRKHTAKTLIQTPVNGNSITTRRVVSPCCVRKAWQGIQKVIQHFRQVRNLL